MRDLLGGKGAELAEMTIAGFPVPPGFTVTTEACRKYNGGDKTVPEGLDSQVRTAMRNLEASTGRGFGDCSNPLLVSVRSGAAVSMQGRMDTVLNLGVNEAIVDAIGRNTRNEGFALDVYCRFIQTFGSVVMGVDDGLFNRTMEELRRREGVTRNSKLGPHSWREAVGRFKSIVKDAAGTDVPEDSFTQLDSAIQAVFDSWSSRRAVSYRDFHGISHDLGTAVNVVSLVFGNMDDNSCSGVLFTRDPSTGEKKTYGEYLLNA